METATEMVNVTILQAFVNVFQDSREMNAKVCKPTEILVCQS